MLHTASHHILHKKLSVWKQKNCKYRQLGIDIWRNIPLTTLMTENQIKQYHREVRDLTAQQDDIYEIIAKLFGDDESNSKDWVFDYLFNEEEPQNLIKFLKDCGKITN